MIMSHLTHFTQFLDWASKLSDGTHLGQAIRKLAKQMSARAPALDFLRFFIEQPVLNLYARILIDGEDTPVEELIVAMTINPEKDLFSIQISDEVLPELVTRNFSLSKLNSLQKLSSDSFTERKKAAMSLQSKLLIAKSTAPIRRPVCKPPSSLGSQHRI